jgi:hypothetical protein
MQMVSIRSMMSAEPKKKLLTQSIKDMAVSRCSKTDIIEFMEEFLKLRKQSLLLAAAVKDNDDADGNYHLKAEVDNNKAEQERAWIDHFLARLNDDKAHAMPPPPLRVSTDAAPAHHHQPSKPPMASATSAQASDTAGIETSASAGATSAEATASAGATSAQDVEAEEAAVAEKRGLMVSQVLRDRVNSPSQSRVRSFHAAAPPPLQHRSRTSSGVRHA